ncbi:ADP-ribosylglycohydrolase family protein [Janibacter cremeus]|uniref:ADP-ribosylglycohydrolase family protein n=1 Tax=Janibacter cremeus TaxID=1285192 RepID=UPI0023F7DA97|nr:ADP-ribosylglycohydrolase family protein [Janibacter cremeus]WEV78812.1 ADP-ribosylglycohydrolase family protein [Janibacter cremeus]
MYLTTAQNDRACGVILGSAVGDALGAGYEFGCAPIGTDGPEMIGGGLGGFAPGEWTDDTSMTWAIAEVAAKGADLTSPEALDDIARGFLRWYDSHPPDIGMQTSSVLGAVSRMLPEELAQQASRREGTEASKPGTPLLPEEVAPRPSRRENTGALAARMTQAATRLHEQTGHTAGNGSLMRTSPVALAHLGDPAAIVEAATAISALTHTDPRAGEACALWSLAINHAVLEGEFDLRAGLQHLPAEAQAFWAARIDQAESQDPSTFTPNGYVVSALQAAWSAIHHTPVPNEMACLHLQHTLDTAIRIGNDTDTVAAIAGGLLGARWGASAVPAAWRRIVHGYPGRTAENLVELAFLATRGGEPNGYGWPGCEYIPYWQAHRPVLVQHPFDEGVWLGNVKALDDLPQEITAVVSLCLTGSKQVPAGVLQVPFRLIDEPAPESNLNLELVITDAARTVADLRAEGHHVLIHCVAAESRTPTVGIVYAMLCGMDVETATEGVCSALPAASPNRGLRRHLENWEFEND